MQSNVSFHFLKPTVPGCKKYCVFIIVVETLLLISVRVRVEVTPGPATKKTNLLFAVWNLDSIHARDLPISYILGV